MGERAVSTPPKRRVLLINRSFQYRQMATLAGVQVLVTVLFGVLMYLFLDSEIKAGLASAHAAYRTLDAMLFPIVLALCLVNVFVSVLLVAWSVLHQTHKIAGPLYRFETALRELSRGNLEPLTKIRDDDQLAGISEGLSAAVHAVAAELTAVRRRVHDLDEAMETGEDRESLARRVDELAEVLERFEKGTRGA